MLNIPSARLTIPKAINGELVRHKLIDAILNSPAKAVYIHGGAGYGKTTLLSQVARNVEKAVWLSLDGENDIFTFVDTFCAAVKQTFPEFDFSASEYLPFCEKNNFISILAGALISTIENILVNFIVVMNDLTYYCRGESQKAYFIPDKASSEKCKILFWQQRDSPTGFIAV